MVSVGSVKHDVFCGFEVFKVIQVRCWRALTAIKSFVPITTQEIFSAVSQLKLESGELLFSLG